MSPNWLCSSQPLRKRGARNKTHMPDSDPSRTKSPYAELGMKVENLQQRDNGATKREYNPKSEQFWFLFHKRVSGLTKKAEPRRSKGARKTNAGNSRRWLRRLVRPPGKPPIRANLWCKQANSSNRRRIAFVPRWNFCMEFRHIRQIQKICFSMG